MNAQPLDDPTPVASRAPASAARRRHWRSVWGRLGRSDTAPPLASAITPTIRTLLFGAALLVLGSSLLSITLPLRLEAAGVAPGLMGPILGAFFAGMILGTRLAPRMILAVGHVRVFAGCAATFSAVVVAHELVASLVAWAALRVIGGFALAALYTVIESWLHVSADNATRGRVHGTYSLAFFAASGVGMLLAGIIDLASAQPFLLATMLVALCLVPIALTRIDSPELPSLEPLSWRELHAASPAALVGAVGSGVIAGSFYSIGPVFARASGLGVPMTTAFMATALAGGLAVQRLIGNASDRFDRRRVLLAVVLLSVITCVLGVTVALRELDRVWLFALAALHGVAVASIYPLSVAQAYDRVTRSRLVAAASRLLTGYAIGAILGPVITGVALDAFGPIAFFASAGIVSLLLTIHVLARMAARPSLPPEAQAPYVLVRPTSPATASLDPRAPDGDPDGDPDAGHDPESDAGHDGDRDAAIERDADARTSPDG